MRTRLIVALSLIALLVVLLVASAAVAVTRYQRVPTTRTVTFQARDVVPCTTDSDCAAKNPSLQDSAQSDSGGVNQDGTAYYYCEALTAKGTRCKHHVRESGLLCATHSRMVKDGKKVKTIN